MHAVRLYAFGPAENLLHETTVPDPEPAPGQVRIAVAAAGVHLLDASLRAGVRRGPLPLPELPTVPGREVAGTVDALGAGADPAWLGRRVVAHLGQAPGGYAELAVADTAALHPVPDGLTEARAVAMIGTGRTAAGLARGVALGPDATVLVLAAAGGLGALLVQRALRGGARVVGAAGGPAKTDVVRGLGAHLAVDYTDPDWAETVRKELGDDRPATALFEGVGGALARAAAGLLAPGAVHVPYGDAATWRTAPGDPGASREELAGRDVRVHQVLGPWMLAHKRELEEEALADAAAGRLTPLVQAFPLAEAARAHRALEERGTVGKVVLVP